MKYSRWTTAEIEFVKNNYEQYTRRELAEILGRSYGAVKSKIDKQLKIGKSVEAIRKRNKRPNAGQFKKGQTPINKAEVGDKTIRKDSNGNDYIWIKVSEKKVKHPIENWEHLHVHLFKNAFGEIPEGKIVAFKDGDQMNCVLENLELITRAESISRARNTDAYVVKCLTTLKGAQGQYDKDLAEEIKNHHPELIEVKRNQLKLNQLIK